MFAEADLPGVRLLPEPYSITDAMWYPELVVRLQAESFQAITGKYQFVQLVQPDAEAMNSGFIQAILKTEGLRIHT